MHNLLRYYRQNRKKIWVTIIFIGFIIGIIQLLNWFTANEMNKNIGQNIQSNEENGNRITDTIPIKETKPAITEGYISETQAKKNKDTIDMFIEYCNNKKVKEAYNLLTDECKETNYPTIQGFINNYYKRVFATARTCSIQNWIVSGNSCTYQITYLEDIISSGKIDNSNSINDYITVIKMEDKEQKLNINSYIGRKEINSTGSNNGVTIKVISKDIYMDYETYHIEVRNESGKSILLDTKKDENTVYLADKNELKYASKIYEVDNNLLLFKNGFSGKLSIRFNKIYGAERDIRSMEFTNIIMDYEKYVAKEDNKEVEQIGRVTINI